jgi:hypothetical protein
MKYISVDTPSFAVIYFETRICFIYNLVDMDMDIRKPFLCKNLANFGIKCQLTRSAGEIRLWLTTKCAEICPKINYADISNSKSTLIFS